MSSPNAINLYGLDTRYSSKSFQPSDLAGLVAWYRPEDLAAAGAQDGAMIQASANAWTDASGNGNHLTSVATSNETIGQNTFVLNAAGTGIPAVSIGSGFYLPTSNSNDPLGGLAGATIVAAFMPSDANTSGGFIFGSQARMRLYDQNNNFGMCHWSGYYPYEAAQHMTSIPHTASSRYNGSTIIGRVDGTQLLSGSISGTTPSLATTSKLTLGTQNDSNGYVFHGYIFGALVYNRSLTDAELIQVESYFKNKLSVRNSVSVPTAQAINLTSTALKDSIGINIHSSYNDTIYAVNGVNPMLDALLKLGVTWVRDGLKSSPQAYVANFLQAINAAGIKLLLNTGQPVDTTGGFATGSSGAAVSALKASPYAGMFAALEMTNEWDNSGRAGWVSEAKAYTAEYYPAFKNDSTLSSIPVYGPSLISAGDYGTYGTDTNNDVVNIHPYSGDVIPEGGFLDAWIAAGQTSQGSSKPVIATEFGWHNAVNGANWVDEQTAADYLIRGIIWNLSKGITRSFLYELFDQKPDTSSNSQQHYGLMALHGVTGTTSTWVQREKPAFTALRNFIKRINDPVTTTSAAISTITYTTFGGQNDTKIVPISRKDGSVDLAIWRAVSLWNSSAHTRLFGRPIAIGLRFARPWAIESFRPADGTTILLSAAASEISIPADGQMTLIRLRPVTI